MMSQPATARHATQVRATSHAKESSPQPDGLLHTRVCTDCGAGLASASATAIPGVCPLCYANRLVRGPRY